MNRSSLRLCAATLSLAVLALPGAAFAGTLGHADPAKDVKKIVSKASGTTTTNAPTQRSADIVRFSAAYTSSRLKETVRLRGLARTWSYTSRIQTPTTRFDLNVTHQSGQTHVSLTQGGGTAVSCDAMTRTVNRTRHIVSATVPAKCLGSPRWVRLGAGMVVLPPAGGVFYADDAFRQGRLRNNLALSGRIHQG